MTNPQQTPLERLRAEKEQLEKACRSQEQKLSETFDYIQENAGSLLLSGISSLLFPGSKTKNSKAVEKTASPAKKTEQNPSPSFGLSDGIALAKTMIPVVWEIAQPLIAEWGIRKVRRMITKLFSSKKKAA